MGRKALYHTAKHDNVSKYLKKRKYKKRSVRNKLNKYALKNCLVLLKDLKNEDIFQLRRDLADINYKKRQNLIYEFSKNRLKKDFKVIINISEAVKLVKEAFDDVDISKIKYEDVYNKVRSWESEELSNFLNKYLLGKMKTVFDSIPLKELRRDTFRCLDESLNELVNDYIRDRVSSNLKETFVLDLLVEDFFTSLHPSFHDRILKDIAEKYIYNRLKDYCEEKKIGILICNSFDKKVLRNGLKITELASGCFFVDPNVLKDKEMCKKMTKAYMNRKMKILIKENLEAKRMCKKEKVKYDMRKTKCIVIKKRKSTRSRIIPEKDSFVRDINERGKVTSLDVDKPILTDNEKTKNVFVKKKRKYSRGVAAFVSGKSDTTVKTTKNCTTASPDSETKMSIAMPDFKRKTPIASPAIENVVTSAAAIVENTVISTAIDFENNKCNTATNIDCIDLTLSPMHEPTFLNDDDIFVHTIKNNGGLMISGELPHTDENVCAYETFSGEETVAKFKKCLDPTTEEHPDLEVIDLTLDDDDDVYYRRPTKNKFFTQLIKESERKRKLRNCLILANFSRQDRDKLCNAITLLRPTEPTFEDAKPFCMNTLLNNVFDSNEYKNSDEIFDVEERDAMVITRGDREKENRMGDINATGNEFKTNAIMVSEKDFNRILSKDKRHIEDVLKSKKIELENIKKELDTEKKIVNPAKEYVVISDSIENDHKSNNELVLKELENQEDREVFEKWCSVVYNGNNWLFNFLTKSDLRSKNCEKKEISSAFDEQFANVISPDDEYIVAAPKCA